MNFVEIFLFVAFVVARQVPLIMTLQSTTVDDQCAKCRLLVGVADARKVEQAGEGILIWRACVVGYFELRTMLYGIVVDVDVDVAPTIEAVMLRF